MASIFISYSRKDLEIMHGLRDYLRAGGLDVWTDEALEPGTPSWQDAIQTAMDHSAALIVILSPDARKSEWVKRELNYASALNLRIFPVLARGTEKDSIPLLLASAQFVDLREDAARGLERLRRAVYQHVGVPLPTEPEPDAIPAAHPQGVGSDLGMPTPATPLLGVGRRSPVLIAAVIAALALVAIVFALSSNSASSSTLQQTQTALAQVATLLPTSTQTATATAPAETQTSAELTEEPASPDLVITGGSRSELPIAAGEISVDITILNRGGARATAFTVGGQLNGAVGHQMASASPLQPGETTLVHFTDTFTTSGDYLATFLIDPENTIPESDEDNNFFEVAFEVKPEDIADLSPGRVDALLASDGQQIAYASARDGDFELYIYDLASDTDYQITFNACDDREPSWSPDASELAYISDCEGSFELFRINLKDQIPIQISYGGAAHSDPTWLRDGYIAFISDESGALELYKIAADGSDQWQLSDNSGIGLFGYDFSPDDTLRVAGVEQDSEADLFIYDPETGISTRITTGSYPDRDPDWSPDGESIAYVEDRYSESGVTKVRLFTISTSTDQLLLEAPVPDPAPDWSPLAEDGSRPVLALIYHDGEHQGIYRLDPESGSLDRLVHDADAADPDWRPAR